MYSLAERGLLGDISNEPSYEAFMKVLKWVGLDNVKFDNTTAEPHEEQFWNQFDNIFDLKEKDMREQLELFVTDPRHQAKIEAFHDGTYNIESEENTRKLI